MSFFGKHLQNGRFLEGREAQNLSNCVEALVETQTFLDDGNEHVDRDGNPDLGLDCVCRGAVELLDA